jgi:hypothetical protein
MHDATIPESVASGQESPVLRQRFHAVRLENSRPVPIAV